MTPNEALTGIATIVGSGGICGVLAAYLAYRKEALRDGRPGYDATVPIAVGDVFGEKAAREALTLAMTDLGIGVRELIGLIKQEVERRKVDQKIDAEVERRLEAEQLRHLLESVQVIVAREGKHSD